MRRNQRCGPGAGGGEWRPASGRRRTFDAYELVWRWRVGVLHQPEPELFLHGGENRGTVADLAVDADAALLGCPGELDCEHSREVGVVQDGPANHGSEAD